MPDPDLRTIVHDLMPGAHAELERLVRIPSVAFPGFDHAQVQASAGATAEILGEAGLAHVEVWQLDDGGMPAVYGHSELDPSKPTVLLYAHHDVQPPGELSEWTTPPYEPVIRDGRMFGRGSSDDKSGIVMHSTTLRAFGGEPPVNVKVIVEGEEEATSEHLDQLVDEHVEQLRADAVVIADAGLWRKGVPALTTSIRGVVAVEVEVRVAEKALHSGVYGSAVPDAITALSRMIATLHDERGNVAVEGLSHDDGPPVDYDVEDFRREAGVRPSVELIGEGSLSDRLWYGPSISVIGIDAPAIRDASFQVVPFARAAITMRLAPGEEPGPALEKLKAHLLANAPWGVEVSMTSDERARGYRVPTGGPFYEAAQRSLRDAWDVEPVDMGMGGSVPLVPELAAVLPEAVILMTGPSDELSAAHSLDESVDLEELERACYAQALFLQYLADGPAQGA